MRPKVLLAIVSLVWLALGVWFVATPYLTVWSLERAAAAGDSEAISEHVDFGALRDSVQAVAAQRVQNVASSLPSGSLAELGKNIVTAFTETAVNAAVTPQTVAMLLRGTRPGVAASASTPVGDFDLSMGYSAFNRFVVEVRGKGSTDPPIQLIFTRSGLATWLLTSLRDPTSSASP
ncbi:MAG TPA: DUF2939 domain-containing protein [Polyangiaceae bacterium]|nr:DUF2939 domain-containing protein [Polyangiaceae bacterium]